MLDKLTTEMIYPIALLGIIVFGAIVNATNQYNLKLKLEGEKVSFHFKNWIIAFTLSSFSGLIGGLIASAYISNQTFVLVAAGMCAFLGIETMNVIGKAMQDFLVGLISKK